MPSAALLETIQLHLQRVASGDITEISDELVEEFGELCKGALKRRYQDGRKDREFRLRMSNIGRPLGQLQREKNGVSREGNSYAVPFRNLFGDLIEAAAIVTMKAAGVNVQSQNEAVELDIGGMNLKGTYDIEIDSGIYDIKSASPYAFTKKFTGFMAVNEEDTFGYVSQGYMYSEASQKPFMGWIVINKAPGEWTVVNTPAADERYRAKVIADAEETIYIMNNDVTPWSCCCEPEDELFRKKATGNKKLGFSGSYCAYKHSCYPGIRYLPSQCSAGKNPAHYWYTEVTNERKPT